MERSHRHRIGGHRGIHTHNEKKRIGKVAGTKKEKKKKKKKKKNTLNTTER